MLYCRLPYTIATHPCSNQPENTTLCTWTTKYTTLNLDPSSVALLRHRAWAFLLGVRHCLPPATYTARTEGLAKAMSDPKFTTYNSAANRAMKEVTYVMTSAAFLDLLALVD